MTGSDPWASTQVRAAGPGRFTADLAPAWDLAVVPQGGVIAAIAARAMEAALDNGQHLRSIHGVFASPVPSGPLEIGVEVLRAGRSASQALADVRAPGADHGFHALAAFGHDRTGPGAPFVGLEPPDVAPPEDCPRFRDGPPPEVDWPTNPPFPFWAEVLEGRAALGHPPWDPAPRGAAENASWMRFDHPPLDATGGFDELALLVVADMMPGSVFEVMPYRPDGSAWFAPSIDLTVHLRTVPSGEWILTHNVAHWLGDGYASAECRIWDLHADGGPQLCAWATQVMLFSEQRR
ncbi:MAG: thioesterase family protein [Actinomycetes bacterium]